MRPRFAFLLVLLAFTGCGDDEFAFNEVTVALDFTPNAVHSGVYTAAEGRSGRRRGLEIRVRAPGASTDSLKLLATGKADFALVDIHDLGLARERGSDVVGLGGIVQCPLAAVIARPEIRRPRELEGKRVGVTGLPSDEAVLRAVVEDDGGDYDQVERITIGFSAVPSLAAGRVDAVVAFWNAEGVALRRRGVPTREFRVDEFGAPRYPELILATTEKTYEESQDLARRVLVAIRDGTSAALSNPDAAIARIARASGADPGLVEAEFTAIRPALSPPLQLDRASLEGWAEFDAEFGILERRPDIEEAFALGPPG